MSAGAGCCPLLLSSWLPAEMLVAVSHLRSSVLVAEQEGRSPHAGMGKPGQSNARIPEPTPLPDCPGAEALSLDGPGLIPGMCVSMGHRQQARCPRAGMEIPPVQQR